MITWNTQITTWQAASLGGPPGLRVLFQEVLLREDWDSDLSVHEADRLGQGVVLGLKQVVHNHCLYWD